MQPNTNSNYKKRKQREFDQPAPIKKRAKRCSKKFIAEGSSTEPNSHITITFGNINGTIDAIILPKEHVLAMSRWGTGDFEVEFDSGWIPPTS